MKYAKFIDLVNNKTSNYGPIDSTEISWEHFKLIKAGSERINYHCNFKDGICFERRRYGSNKNIKSKMCCCVDCFSSIGHFRHFWQDNKIEMEILAKRFIEPKDPTKLTDSGFWRIEKGCILPRMHRSLICLRYTCNTSMSKIDLFYLHNILAFYNYRKVQNKLIKFMAKKNNNQFLPLDEMSPVQRELAIDTLWKFVEQEFDKYKKRTELS